MGECGFLNAIEMNPTPEPPEMQEAVESEHNFEQLDDLGFNLPEI